MFEEIKDIKSGKGKLREFGLTVGIILVILGAVAFWRNRGFYPYLLGVGTALVISGVAFPVILKPLQKIWMSFSVVLGFFISRFVLAVLFYLVLTPMGLATRLLGKDILGQEIDKNRKSYWHDREVKIKPKESYENQY